MNDNVGGRYDNEADKIDYENCNTVPSLWVILSDKIFEDTDTRVPIEMNNLSPDT